MLVQVPLPSIRQNRVRFGSGDSTSDHRLIVWSVPEPQMRPLPACGATIAEWEVLALISYIPAAFLSIGIHSDLFYQLPIISPLLRLLSSFGNQ